MTREMFDGIASDAPSIPAAARLVAGYDDGLYAWSAADWALFPASVHVHIAVFASTDSGHVLDIETGDATPAQSVDWVLMRRRAGADPTVYCNTSTWPEVRSAFAARGVAEPHYWLAQYDGVAQLLPGAVAKQYADDVALGRPYDLSVVADYWPGVDPAPAPDPAPTPVQEDYVLQQIEPTSVHPGEYSYGINSQGGAIRTVRFSCDGYGGVASLRVVTWDANGCQVHTVSVGGQGTEFGHHLVGVPFGDAPSTYQVTVKRTDTGTFPIGVSIA